MSRSDKVTIVFSSLLLLAILAAGGYGLSKAYYYDEPAADEPRNQ